MQPFFRSSFAHLLPLHICFKAFRSHSQTPMNLVDLPDCILDRIGYFVLEVEKATNLLHSLRQTCKQFFHHYSVFLYTSLPVVLKETSKGKYLWCGRKKRFDTFECTHIRDLRISSFTHFYLPCQNLLLLRFLTIEALDFSFLFDLPAFPKLCSLSIIYNHRLLRGKLVASWVPRLEETIKTAEFPRLEILRISSKKPRINIPYKCLFSNSWLDPRRIEDYDKQFSSDKRTEKYRKKKRKHHDLGYIFYMLLENSMGSLKVVECLGLDFSFIMSRNRTIKFTNPCTLILNNPSIIHAYSWKPQISAKNRLNILIEDQATGAVHVTVKRKNEELGLIKRASLLSQVRASIKEWSAI